MFIALGIIFGVIGIVMIGFSVLQAVAMAGGYELDARIVDYERKETVRYNNGHRRVYLTYAPVYEYVDAGNTKRYTSAVFMSVIPEVGEETTIFISRSGKVVDKRGAVGILIMGIVLVVFGAVGLAVGLKG